VRQTGTLLLSSRRYGATRYPQFSCCCNRAPTPIHRTPNLAGARHAQPQHVPTHCCPCVHCCTHDGTHQPQCCCARPMVPRRCSAAAHAPWCHGAALLLRTPHGATALLCCCARPMVPRRCSAAAIGRRCTRHCTRVAWGQQRCYLRMEHLQTCWTVRWETQQHSTPACALNHGSKPQTLNMFTLAAHVVSALHTTGACRAAVRWICLRRTCVHSYAWQLPISSSRAGLPADVVVVVATTAAAACFPGEMGPIWPSARVRAIALMSAVAAAAVAFKGAVAVSFHH
jgi:hypothetical protein